MGERLQHLSSHDALLLLRHSLAIPKLLYILRSSPSFLSPCLKSYDDELRALVSRITNVPLEDPAWSQASLPVRCGGLGIRSAVQLAPSAFLSSAAGSSDLVRRILPDRLDITSPCLMWRKPKTLGLRVTATLSQWANFPIGRRLGTTRE